MTFALLSRLADGTFLGVNLLFVLATLILIQKVCCAIVGSILSLICYHSLQMQAKLSATTDRGTQTTRAIKIHSSCETQKPRGSASMYYIKRI